MDSKDIYKRVIGNKEKIKEIEGAKNENRTTAGVERWGGGLSIELNGNYDKISLLKTFLLS